MSETLLQKLVTTYYATRPNLTVVHSPLCVFFFACSGAGKSTTRRLLVDEFAATYVCNDEVRELLAQYPEAAASGIELKTIVAGVVEKIFAEAANKFVIFDNNIIQYYMHEDSYLNVAKASHRPVYIIGLDIPEDQLVARIRSRGVYVAHLLGELPDQLAAYHRAANDLKPNISLKPGSNSEELLASLRNIKKNN